jgi:hypothetical protein
MTRTRGVPFTRTCECGHDQGRHDAMTNACLVRGCSCTHCETTPDLRTQAGRAYALRHCNFISRRDVGKVNAVDEVRPSLRALPPPPPDPIPFALSTLSQNPNETPASDSPPCRYCPSPSTFLLIAYRQPGWPTTPLCNDCLCNFVRRALASTPQAVTPP